MGDEKRSVGFDPRSGRVFERSRADPRAPTARIPYRMRKHVISGLAALVAAAVPISAKADADAFPWKLFESAPNGTFYIAHEYATEQACRSDGEIAARELTASNCSANACAVPVWCVDQRAAEISVVPGTGAPLKVQCHPGYYGIAPGATKPAQHPEWCEYVRDVA
jgi:hypothetical protein